MRKAGMKFMQTAASAAVAAPDRRRSRGGLGMLVLAAAVFLVPLVLPAADAPTGFMVVGPYARIQTRLVSGDPLTTNSTLSIAVEVVSNSTGIFPGACAFRARFRSDALEWLPPTAGQLGSLFYSNNNEGAAPNVFRDVATGSNPSNRNLTPLCFTLRFRVIDPRKAPYGVSVENDPGSARPLLAVDLETPIPHSFDNGATANLGGNGD